MSEISHPRSDAWPPQHVAIVYDRVNTRHGGAELVLTTLQTAFPQADLLTSVANLNQAQWATHFPHVLTSWLQNWPSAAKWHRWLAILMPLAFESLSVQKYDLILSVTSAEAKGIITTPNQLHVCYLLAPPRYLYHQRTELLADHWLTRLPLVHQVAQQVLNYLQWWDQVAIHRPDIVIPLSQRVTKQLQQFYSWPPRHVDKVLYPPIELPNQLSAVPKAKKTRPLINSSLSIQTPYFLQVSRLVPYKKVILSMQAAAQTQQNLVVVGEGPDAQKLTTIAQQLNATTQSKIMLLGAVTPVVLQQLYQNCQAVLVPGAEDFGLTALEANAAGKPAIVYAESGVAEVIQPDKHGLHLQTQTTTELAKTLTVITQKTWSPQLLRQNAAKYGTNKFVAELTTRLKAHWLAFID